MLRSVVRRPSPATIIALLVLVIVAAPLADAAQKAVSAPKAQSAAEKKKKKSTSKTVEKAKYADNAGKIRGYSVGFAGLPNRVVLTDGNGKLPASIIPAGTQVGPQGPAGAPGAPGPKGAGFGQVRIVPSAQATSATSDIATAEADCDATEKVVGGGYEVVYPVRATATDRSGPVEIRINKPVVPTLPPESAAGRSRQSGCRRRSASCPTARVASRRSRPASPDKLVVIKAWAVCAK